MHFRKRTFLLIVIVAAIVSMILGAAQRTQTLAVEGSGKTYWLTVGQVNEEVYYLQVMMQYLGYYTYDLDGDFGKLTEEAVLRFQKDYSLYPDGIAGDETIGKLWSLIGETGVQNVQLFEIVTTQQTQDLSSHTDYNSSLSIGISGSSAVEELQILLRDWGYYTQTIDGDFGHFTDTAVRQFQADHDLYVDGIVGPITWNALLSWRGYVVNASSGQSPSSADPFTMSDSLPYSQAGFSVNVRTLQNGMTGEDVTLLQNCLLKWGFLDSIVDGVFGEYTKAAVIRFQQAKGLYVDGIVGPQTWTALYNVSEGTSSSQSESQITAGTTITSAQVQAVGIDSFFYVEEISDTTFARMWGRSFQPNSYISRDDLRYIRCLHKDINGTIKVGELVMHKRVADSVCKILRVLYNQSYPIQSMVLVDEFGGNDELSIMYNNTSAFNYRTVDDTSELSYHAFGMAIDINPYYNVYYIPDQDYVFPEKGRQYLDRNASFPYKLSPGDLCYNLFTAAGFSWGGWFEDNPDYQHFYYTGISG